MSDYFLRKILDDEQVKIAKELVSNLRWAHGTGSFGYNDERMNEDQLLRKKVSIKNNFESVGPITSIEKLDKIIHSSLDTDDAYLDYTSAWYSGKPLYSKMGPGGYFRSHHDNHKNGHYSTTVFLSNPDEYEGGELALCTSSGIETFKPPAGYAVTYTTGTPHEVKEVANGLRYVGILWTKSLFVDPFIRDLYTSISRLERSFPDKTHDTIEDAMEDPQFVLQGILYKLRRHYTSDGMY